MDLFSNPLHHYTVPLCFKAATTIPVRKKTKVKALNDYCPVVLTSVLVKVLKRLTVLMHLKFVTNAYMNPLQCANMDKRYPDDAGALALPFVVQHLESPNMHPVRLASCICYHSMHRCVTGFLTFFCSGQKLSE